jgi:hypothetical protein
MATAFCAARPGVTNRDIAAEAAYVMLKAGCEEAGLQVVSGPGVSYMGTGNWVLEPRRKLQAGDMLLVDMGILYLRMGWVWAATYRVSIRRAQSLACQRHPLLRAKRLYPGPGRRTF